MDREAQLTEEEENDINQFIKLNKGMKYETAKELVLKRTAQMRLKKC